MNKNFIDFLKKIDYDSSRDKNVDGDSNRY